MSQAEVKSVGKATLVWRHTIQKVLGLGAAASALAVPLALTANAAPPPSLVPFMAQAKQQIVIHGPVIVPYPYPYPYPYPTRPQQRVRVEFVAQGTDWGAVYLDNRLIFQPTNFNRRRSFMLERGAYRLTITGANRFEVWGRGYLDVGRDDSNILVVTFSKNGGISVSGSPYAWIPE